MYPSIHHHYHPYHLTTPYPHPHHHPRSHFSINLPSIQSLLQEVDGQAFNSIHSRTIDLTLPPLKSYLDPNPNPNLNHLHFPHPHQNKFNQHFRPSNHHHLLNHQLLNQDFIDHESYQIDSNLKQLSSKLQSSTQPKYKLSSKSILNRPKRKQVKRACQNCQKACKGCADSRPCPRCVIHGLTKTCRDAPRKSELLKSPNPFPSTCSLNSPTFSTTSSDDSSDSTFLSNQIKVDHQRLDHHSNHHQPKISIKSSNLFTNQTTQNL
ncbi:hypothetical protein DFH28DRAFT_1077965 [Melampsora americana]|nr:hypothetical protein DFH28DRAFT_1077965 [Melampsora americana]